MSATTKPDNKIQVPLEDFIELNRNYGICLGLLEAMTINCAVPHSIQESIKKTLSNVV